MDIPEGARPIQNADVAWREIDGEAVLVVSSQSELKILNGTGTHIWKLCDGEITICQMAENISDCFQVSPGEALDDINAFISELYGKRLVDFKT